jgi:16S rRNA (guanine1516-N2)-methyltransferase
MNLVGYARSALRAKAEHLASLLGFEVMQEASFCLFVAEDRLALKFPNCSLMSPDFSASTWQRRTAEGKKQGLIRACKPVPDLRIIDATAGFGKDAAILASFGAQVLMIERHPVMALLLEDALARQSAADKAALKLSLCHADAITTLQNLSELPDLIYIDPMHPLRQKSALTKKDMQMLQALIGADEDALQLISIAQQRVKRRVVVKWPQKQPSLIAPQATIVGKTVKFDLYNPK